MEMPGGSGLQRTFSILLSQQLQRTKKGTAGKIESVQIQAGPVLLDGDLEFTEKPRGLVVFIHDRHLSLSAAGRLRDAGMATLRFDILTPEESELDLKTRHLHSDISLLARRTIGVLDWVTQQQPVKELRICLFGAGSGTSAALIAAAERPDCIAAIFGQCSSLELAASTLPRVKAPTMLVIVQENEADEETETGAVEQGQREPKHAVHPIPNTARPSIDADVMDRLCQTAVDWFDRHLAGPAGKRTKNINKG